MFEMLILMLDATIRPASILAAMAGMFCERSGWSTSPLEASCWLPPSPVNHRHRHRFRLDWAGGRGGDLHPVRPAARLRHHHPPG